MKTLAQFKAESEIFYSENAATYFAPSFSKKMGGTATITFEDDFLSSIKIDKREYYIGRGSKYNSNSMHEHIDLFVSKKEFNERVASRGKRLFDYEKEKNEKRRNLIKFCKLNGITSKLYSEFSETMGVFFDEKFQKEIEKELGVDLTDFFESKGKTYYFANSKIGRLEFFHNHHQSFSFKFVSEEYENKFKKDRDSWVNARYAYLLGNIYNPNLYVC